MGTLSIRKIRDLKKPGRYGDGDGLYLHIRDGGSRQWLLRTTVHGKRTDIGLGSADILTLDEAREAARSLRKTAKLGGDPLHERRREKSVPTYREAADTVWETHRGTWKNPKHADQWINTQRTYAFPIIGDLRVDQITSAHVLDVLGPIWLEKEETARRLRQRLRTVFDWAKASGYRSGDSPLEGVDRALPRQTGKVRHHPALPWQQLPDFVLALREREAVAALALQMLILTVLRSSELRHGVWNEIDWDNNLWIVPAERMKMKREHHVPLPPEAVGILNVCKGLGSNYIFPSDNPQRPLSDMAFSALIKRMGWQGLTPHGFRSTFRDWSSENDAAPAEVAEMVLAHVVGSSTEQAYLRSRLTERRRPVMERWAEFAHSRRSE